MWHASITTLLDSVSSRQIVTMLEQLVGLSVRTGWKAEDQVKLSRVEQGEHRHQVFGGKLIKEKVAEKSGQVA